MSDPRVDVIAPLLARMSFPARGYAGDYWRDQAVRMLRALDDAAEAEREEVLRPRPGQATFNAESVYDMLSLSKEGE